MVNRTTRLVAPDDAFLVVVLRALRGQGTAKGQRAQRMVCPTHPFSADWIRSLDTHRPCAKAPSTWSLPKPTSVSNVAALAGGSERVGRPTHKGGLSFTRTRQATQLLDAPRRGHVDSLRPGRLQRDHVLEVQRVARLALERRRSQVGHASACVCLVVPTPGADRVEEHDGKEVGIVGHDATRVVKRHTRCQT